MCVTDPGCLRQPRGPDVCRQLINKKGGSGCQASGNTSASGCCRVRALSYRRDAHPTPGQTLVRHREALRIIKLACLSVAAALTRRQQAGTQFHQDRAARDWPGCPATAQPCTARRAGGFFRPALRHGPLARPLPVGMGWDRVSLPYPIPCCNEAACQAFIFLPVKCLSKRGIRCFPLCFSAMACCN